MLELDLELGVESKERTCMMGWGTGSLMGIGRESVMPWSLSR